MISLERNLKCLEHKPVKIFNVTFKTEKARTVHTKQKFYKFKSNDNLRIKKQKITKGAGGGGKKWDHVKRTQEPICRAHPY